MSVEKDEVIDKYFNLSWKYSELVDKYLKLKENIKISHDIKNVLQSGIVEWRNDRVVYPVLVLSSDHYPINFSNLQDKRTKIIIMEED